VPALVETVRFRQTVAMTCALITGASAGLGLEYARLFAADKHDVILVARRRDRLEALARELEKSSAVRAHAIAVDLGAAGGAAKLIEEVKKLAVPIDFLVNNAGFGSSGAFAALALEREMIQLNIAALVELTRAFLPEMLARKRGRILNLGSTAGFQPGPFMATYYASKAFVNSFSEALAFELRESGVTATVSCPGATATEFAQVAGTSGSRLFAAGVAAAAQVAREGYVAMHKGKPMVVHGAKSRFLVQSLRFSPRALVLSIAASLNRSKAEKELT
jgi:short-subunit dehydrogenase